MNYTKEGLSQREEKESGNFAMKNFTMKKNSPFMFELIERRLLK